MKEFVEAFLTPLLMAVAGFMFGDLLLTDGHTWFAVPIFLLASIAALVALANSVTLAKNHAIASHAKEAAREEK